MEGQRERSPKWKKLLPQLDLALFRHKEIPHQMAEKHDGCWSYEGSVWDYNTNTATGPPWIQLSLRPPPFLDKKTSMLVAQVVYSTWSSWRRHANVAEDVWAFAQDEHLTTMLLPRVERQVSVLFSLNCFISCPRSWSFLRLLPFVSFCFFPSNTRWKWFWKCRFNFTATPTKTPIPQQLLRRNNVWSSGCSINCNISSTTLKDSRQ